METRLTKPFMTKQKLMKKTRKKFNNKTKNKNNVE